MLDGTAEIWVDEERATLTAGQSMIVPAGLKHGFQNVGDSTLHVHATLAAPYFEASFDDKAEEQRRWVRCCSSRLQDCRKGSTLTKAGRKLPARGEENA